jgi:hypothetical protein
MKSTYWVGGIVITIFLSIFNSSVSAALDPLSVDYESVAYNQANNSTHTGGTAVIDVPGLSSWGSAGIEYHAWQSETNGYWYYAYKILNNGQPGTDYHFGFNTTNNDPLVYYEVYKFGLTMNIWNDGMWNHGPEDLVIKGFAGSSAGGDAWGASAIDLYNSGFDYTTTNSSGTPEKIAPSRWKWNPPKGKNPGYYSDITTGNTSTDDSSLGYFEIISNRAPGWIKAELTNTAEMAAYSDNLSVDGVLGPVGEPIPEPVTMLLFGLGALGVISNRRKVGGHH